MIREGLVVVALIAATGCGADNEQPRRAETGEATRSTTSASTATADPGPTKARSVRQCAELWNAAALPPESYQVTANEFVAKEAPVRVHVAYHRGHCFVVWPIGRRRIAVSAAAGGRRPFGNPDQRQLEPGERVPYNGRADREGHVDLE